MTAINFHFQPPYPSFFISLNLTIQSDNMKLDFTTLDVFSSIRYTGNPVAIIPVPASAKNTLTQTQKQSIASEFNLSEIVFLHLPTDPTSPERHIDIFTSHAEVPFAGHPTIGTSHYLLHTTKQNVTSLITKAGRIPIRLEPETQNVKAEIPHDFHQHAVTWSTPLNDLANPTCSIVNGMSFIMVEVSFPLTLTYSHRASHPIPSSN